MRYADPPLVEPHLREGWRCWMGQPAPRLRFNLMRNEWETVWVRYYYERWYEPDGRCFAQRSKLHT
jgi:hypothetical protein